MDDQRRLALYKLAAKQQVGVLRAELSYHRAHEKASTTKGLRQLEEVYQKVQRCIVQGHLVQRGLATYLENTNADPDQCSELFQLQNVLTEAITEQSKWHPLLFQQQKKDCLHSFKESLVDFLQRGGFSHWISTVTRKDILNQGDELNLLFQFLQFATSCSGPLPVLDSETLVRAAERTDLFTPKQSQSLRLYSTKVAAAEQEALTLRLVQQEKQERVGHSLAPTRQLQPTASPDDNRSIGLCKHSWACPQSQYCLPTTLAP